MNKNKSPRKAVAILMGSDSDLEIMQGGMDALDKLGIEYSVEVLSAHRIPEKVRAFSAGAEKRGFKVIIAAAGGAAHLPGIVSAYTALPVIGVPIPSGMLDGADALFSMCQMPGGVPVATMGVGKWGAKNAALFAARILSLNDRGARTALENFRKAMEKDVLEKGKKLKRILARKKTSD